MGLVSEILAALNNVQWLSIYIWAKLTFLGYRYSSFMGQLPAPMSVQLTASRQPALQSGSQGIDLKGAEKISKRAE